MATIHIIYDPRSKITGLNPEQLQGIGASSIVFQVDNTDFGNLDLHQLTQELATRLLAQVRING